MKAKTCRSFFLCLLFVLLAAILMTVAIGGTTLDKVAAEESSDLGFITDTETGGYKVKALNKGVTEVVIPDTYKGLPVTSIMDNGFTNCTALEKVVIPSSVKTIGSNAFLRCTNLKKVMGLSGVETVGNNVFFLCPNLEYFILPRSVKSIGTAILRDVDCTLYSRQSETELAALGTEWNAGFLGEYVYGNDLVYEKYTNENGEEGVSLVSWQNIDLGAETGMIIETWHEDTRNSDGDKIEGKLLNIAEYAFVGCTAGDLIIRHPENTVYDHTINIESSAFALSYFDSITIEANISFPENSELQFNSAASSSITLPDSVDVIPQGAFSDCSNLVELRFLDGKAEANRLSDKVTRIEDSAFSNCTGLPTLYISKNIQYIGREAFAFWGQTMDQTISIDLKEASEDWSEYWSNGIGDRCTVEFTAADTYVVNLITECDGVEGATGNMTVYVTPGSKLSDYAIDAPVSDSHDFTGVWYGTEDRLAGTEYSVDNPIRGDLTLYAGWSKKVLSITFIKSKVLTFIGKGGEVLDGTSVSYEYGKICEFSCVLSNGYVNPVVMFGDIILSDLHNTLSYSFQVKVGGVVYVYDYDFIRYEVTFICEPEANNPYEDNLTYNVEQLPLTLEAPTWAAYEMGEWQIAEQEGGPQIEVPNLIPVGTYGNLVFKAKWIKPVKFNISFDYGVGNNYLKSMKSAYEESIKYDIETPTFTLKTPVWMAYSTFEWDTPTINQGTWKNITVHGQWSNPREFDITINNLRGCNNKFIQTYTFERGVLLLNPEWTAYESSRWNIVSAPFGNTDGIRNTDLGLDIPRQCWGSVTVEAVWSNRRLFYVNYANAADVQYYYTNEACYTTADNPNDTVFGIGDTLSFEFAPGKDGYKGQWNINQITITDDFDFKSGLTIYNTGWQPITYKVYIFYVDGQLMDTTRHLTSAEVGPTLEFEMTYGESRTIDPITIKDYYFYGYYVNYADTNYAIKYQDSTKSLILFNERTVDGSILKVALSYMSDNCVKEGTLITLADGTQKAVEDLTGNEMLLVWNLYTGTFDVAPMIFVDKDPAREYTVINLSFSDGTEVGVISEHGFWDFTLNKYVYLGTDAAQYIGHWFNRQVVDKDGQLTWTKVQLTNVTVTREYTTAYSPVTYGHLCYYVNGMLSMPGGIDGLFNIFEVDSETMKYNAAAMQSDIETYGLFTYEEFAEILPVSLEMFEAVNGQYLKVAIGKGLINFEILQKLIERYSVFFVNL